MPKTKKANLLIVDDNHANIVALEQILQKVICNILTASSVNHALKIILNEQIDLIILDVKMPGMDGFEIAQIIKSNKRTRDIPIIFVSAEKKEHKFAMKSYEEGAIDYLYKPLDPEITKAKVSVLLQLQMQRKELLEKNQTLEKYALLIDNSADIKCIIDPRTFKFNEVNRAINTILGYTIDEIKDTSLMLYLTEESKTKVQKLSSTSKNRFSFETRIYSKNRKIKWLQWNVVFKDRIWFANARDITEVKEVEEIRKHLTAVVKQSEDAVYLHDPEGQIISWNDGAEKIYGFSEEEALKMHIWNIVPGHLMKETQEAINNILKGKRVRSAETKRITKFGKIIDVLFSATVITDSDRRLKSVAITERDITKQKKADEEIKQLNYNLKRNVAQLEETNKELESFSYSVSHDLRAPLRAINGFTRIIMNKHSAEFNEELSRLFGIVENSSVKMGELIDDLLSFSRLGRSLISKSDVNFYSLVEEILDEIEIEKKYKININLNSSLNLSVDRSMLKQVFINLISNAIKYSRKKENPVIEINSEEKDNEYIFFVKDNGAGFNMDYVDKLFGVFQRLHSEDEYEGTGVGLSIVHKIITKHLGKVWATGEVGKGATFYFSLPKDNI
ncbi:MAG: PAS domain S-box protein [Ignavibacteria bacterium]